MHIYAFGSVCRGEVTQGSDIDLLALVESFDPRFDIETYSVYSYRRIAEIWAEGNPFAWHLSKESRLLFSADSSDYLRSLGDPHPYRRCAADCEKFFKLFEEACQSLTNGSACPVFDLSTLFLSIRNFATCFSLGMTTSPDFSRHSALHLGAGSLAVSQEAYGVLERSRLLCTRGYGPIITASELDLALKELNNVRDWMLKLKAGIR